MPSSESPDHRRCRSHDGPYGRPGPAVRLSHFDRASIGSASLARANVRHRRPHRTTSIDPSAAPLPLRLVDSGGVGIPADASGWGHDYSHDARIFHDVLLDKAPYVDAAAFQRVEQDWHAYVERMLAYGNNAMAVPMLLELIDFDRVKTADGSSVYGDGDETFRARHAAVRRAFGPLFEWTARRGMQVFLTTDMLTVTPPLARHLRRVAPAASVVGIDAADPAVWQVYRAGLDELFDTMPAISGLVIRFGEGGNLYNTAGWPYRSEVAVRDAKSLRAMLHGLLPIFEGRQKTLVLRSWTRRCRIDRPPAHQSGALRDRARRHRLAGARRVDQIHGRRFLQLSAAQSDAPDRTPSASRRVPGAARVRRLRRVPRFPRRGVGARPADDSRHESASRRHVHLHAVRRTAARGTAHALSLARLLALDRRERLRRVATRDEPSGRRPRARAAVGERTVR